jgi:hypothetical protein
MLYVNDKAPRSVDVFTFLCSTSDSFLPNIILVYGVTFGVQHSSEPSVLKISSNVQQSAHVT